MGEIQEGDNQPWKEGHLRGWERTEKATGERGQRWETESDERQRTAFFALRLLVLFDLDAGRVLLPVVFLLVVVRRATVRLHAHTRE